MFWNIPYETPISFFVRPTVTDRSDVTTVRTLTTFSSFLDAAGLQSVTRLYLSCTAGTSSAWSPYTAPGLTQFPCWSPQLAQLAVRPLFKSRHCDEHYGQRNTTMLCLTLRPPPHPSVISVWQNSRNVRPHTYLLTVQWESLDFFLFEVL